MKNINDNFGIFCEIRTFSDSVGAKFSVLFQSMMIWLRLISLTISCRHFLKIYKIFLGLS